MNTYSAQLKSPKWQKKRLEILNKRGFKCEICGNEENELHVHHRFYIKNRMPWEYDGDVFQVLCSVCHEKQHLKKEIIEDVVPKKYEELIIKLEKVKNLDIRNIISLFIMLEDNSIDEMFRLLAKAANSGWIENALDVIRDKEKIENLEIELIMAINNFKKLNTNIGYES